MTDTITAPQDNGIVPEGALNPSPETLAAARDASLPIGTVDGILAKAPTDSVEELVPIPEWGCSVRIRSLNAGVAAKIKAAFVNPALAGALFGGKAEVDMADIEALQFKEGVVEPAFTDEQVRQLQRTSSTGFGRVIGAIDSLRPNEEAVARVARETFPDGGATD